MALRFRNLTITPDDPVEEWGVEGLLAAIDRGDLTHWQRIAAAVTAEPRGHVANDLAVAIDLAEFEDSATVLRQVLQKAQD